MQGQYLRPKDFDDYLKIFGEFGLIEREPEEALPRDFERIQVNLEDLMEDEASDEDLGKLEKWLERAEVFGEDWTSGEPSKYERLAWYQPITFSQNDAGIFLTLRGLRSYASKNLSALRKTSLSRHDAVRAAWFGAFSQLLTHEIFHHQIEWMAFRFDTNFDLKGSPFGNPSHTRSRRYVEYSRNVYRPNLHLSPKGAIEEALASANEFVNFPRSFKTADHAFRFSDQAQKEIRERIRNGYASRPVGYREAPNYLDKFSFWQGVSSLLAQVFNPTLTSPAPVLPPGLGIQRSELTNHFLHHFTIVVEGNDSSINDFPMRLMVPDRNLKKLLKAEGFYPTDLGNGSHEVWKKPGSPMVTIPNRKDQAGLKFLKSAAKSLGFRNIRELQEAARGV